MRKGTIAAMACIFVCVALLLASCDGDLFGAKKPIGVTLSPSQITYDSFDKAEGIVQTLTAQAALKGGTTSTDIRWKFPDDTSLYEILSNTNGTLSFLIKKAGNWSVEAQAWYKGEIGAKASCVVSVKGFVTGLGIKSSSTGSAIDIGSVIYTKGQETLLPVYTPADTTQTGVVWSCDTTDIVSVRQVQGETSATILGKAAGTAAVTVTSQSNPAVSKTISVTVKESGSSQTTDPTKVALSPSGTLTLPIGQTKAVTAAVQDGFSHPVASGDVSWQTSDPAVASVTAVSDRIGSIRAVSGGTAIVTASYGDTGLSSRIYVTVSGGIEGIAGESSFYSLLAGDTEDVKVSYSPSSTIQRGFTASSSDPSVASVMALGDNMLRITAVRKGQATVSLKSSAVEAVKSRDINVLVSDAVSDADRIRSVTLDQQSLQFEPPYSPVQVKASVSVRLDSGEIAADNAQKVTFSISDPSVASIRSDGQACTVTPLKPGSASLTVRSAVRSDAMAECLVSAGGKLQALVPSAMSLKVPSGETYDVMVTPYPANAVLGGISAQTTDASAAEASAKRNADGTYLVTVKGTGIGKSEIVIGADSAELARIAVETVAKAASQAFSISLDSSSIQMAQDGDPESLAAVPLGKDGKAVDEILEFSLDKASAGIVSITQSANTVIISPLNAGTAIISVTSPGNPYISARCRVEVGGAAVQGQKLRGISLPYDSITIIKGSSESLLARPIPSGAAASVSWSSSDASAVQASGNGELGCTLFGIGEGTSVITASSADDPSLRAALKVTVIAKAAVTDTTIASASISCSGTQDSGHVISGRIGETVTLSASARDKAGMALPLEMFDWSISAQGTASLLGQTGTSASARTAAFGGMQAPAVVTATSRSNPAVSASFRIYCIDGAVPDGSLELIAGNSSITIEKGSKLQVPYYAVPDSGPSVIWTSSSSCVSLSDAPAQKILTVTGVSAGKAVITGRSGDASCSISAEVVAEAGRIDTSITKVELDRWYLSYDLNSKALQAITATVFRNGVADPNEKVTWSSDNADIASVAEAGGKGVVSHRGKTGTTRIVASSASQPSVKAACFVEVIDSSAGPGALRFLTLSSSAMRMEPGAETQLSCASTPKGSDAQLRWTSSDPEVAEVSGGLVRAMSEGSAEITAEAVGTGISDSCSITVRAQGSEEPRSIDLSDSVVKLSQRDMDAWHAITARVVAEDGSILPGYVTWSISDEGGAVVSRKGLNSMSVSPRNAGTAVITASFGSLSTECLVIVGQEDILSLDQGRIAAESGKAVMEAGDSLSIKAYPIPESGDALSWASTDGSVASVRGSGRTGLITAAGKGSCMVSVSRKSDASVIGFIAIEVVGKGETAGKPTRVVLDSHHIIIDAAGKKLTSLSARALSGSAASGEHLTWAADASLSGCISLEPSADSFSASVTPVQGAEGSGWITVSATSDSSLDSRCFVSVMDSSKVTPDRMIGLTLSRKSIAMAPGETAGLTASVSPSSVKNASVSWTSSAPSVASVSLSGIVRAVGPGRAEITARASWNGQSLSSSCTVTCTEETGTAKASRITLSPGVLYLSQDEMDVQKSIKATVLGPDGLDAGLSAGWRVEGEGVIDWTCSGGTLMAVPVSAGVAKAVAFSGSVENEALVIVGAPSLAVAGAPRQLLANPGHLTVRKGSSFTVRAAAVPGGSMPSLAWASDDLSIAAVSGSGATCKVTGVSAGETTVTAVSDDDPTLNASFSVKVIPYSDGSISAIILDKSYVALDMAGKDLARIGASVYVDGRASSSSQIEWSLAGMPAGSLSISPADSYGSAVSLTKLAAGTGYVMARDPAGDAYALCAVDVIDTSGTAAGLEALILSQSAVSMAAGSSLQLTASSVPEGQEGTLVWSTSDTSVATVSASGLVMAQGEGSAAITARSYENPAVSASCAVSVAARAASRVPSSISLDRQVVTLSQDGGAAVRITAVVKDASGSAMEGADVSWTLSSGAGSIISASSDGSSIDVSPLSAGTATVNASCQSARSSCTVIVGAASKVVSPSLTGLLMNPSSLTLNLAGTSSAAVTAEMLPAAVAGLSAEWSSSDPSVASVERIQSADGKARATVRALSKGTAQVTVTAGGKSAALQVTVVSTAQDPVTSLALDKASIILDLAEKGRARLTAAAMRGSEKDASQQILWTSSNLNPGKPAPASYIVSGPNGSCVDIAKLAAGEMLLTASCKDSPSAFASCYVQVIDSSSEPARLRMLIPSGDIQLSVGQTGQVSASPYEAVQGLTYLYSSQEPSVATVSSTGAVKAVSAGTSLISISAAGHEDVRAAELTVTVNAPQAARTPASVVLDRQAVTLSQERMDETVRITAVVKDASGAAMDGADVTWTLSSGAGSVIAASSEGRRIDVSPLSAGTATVTAVCQSARSSCTVIVGAASKVAAPELSGLLLNPSSLVLNLSGASSSGVSAEMLPAAIDGLEAEWTSSDQSVATVAKAPSADGRAKAVITAVSEGTARITASAGGKSASLPVTVVRSAGNPLSSVWMDKSSIVLDLADKALTRISASAMRGSARDSSQTLVWTASLDDPESPAPASFAVSGTNGSSVDITKKAAGAMLLTASCQDSPGVYTTCRVQVVDSSLDLPVLRMLIPSGDIQLSVGQTAQVKATPYEDVGALTYIYSSNPSSVASVSGSGAVKALSAGSCTVSVSAAGHEDVPAARIAVTVLPPGGDPVASISIDPSSYSIEGKGILAEELRFTASVYTAGGIETQSTVKWTVSDGSLLRLSQSGNTLTIREALKESGSCIITAACGSASQSAAVTVSKAGEAAPAGYTAIVVNPSAFTLERGAEKALSAITVPVQGPALRWAVSDSSVATVSPGGVVTAAGQGRTAVMAYSPSDLSVKGTSYVTVLAQEAKAGSVRITEGGEAARGRYSLGIGGSVSLEATAVSAEGSDMAAAPAWSVSGTAVTVSHQGKAATVTATALGAATVTASSGQASSSVTFLVSAEEQGAAALERIALSQSSLSLVKGESYALSCEAVPKGCPASILWSSSDTSVAAVSKDGMVRGAGRGDAVIKATDAYTGISASCPVSVTDGQSGAAASSIALSSQAVSLSQEDMDRSFPLTASVIGTGGSAMGSAQVTWVFGKGLEAIAGVEADGNEVLLTPRSAGTASITALYGELSASCLVVTGMPSLAASGLQRIAVMPRAMEAAAGSTVLMGASVVPEGARASLSWSSSDAGVLSVAGNGFTATASAVSEGSAVVTARDPSTGISGSADVIVSLSTAGRVTAVLLDKSAIALDMAQKTLTAVNAGVYVNGALSSDQGLDWTFAAEGGSDPVAFAPVNQLGTGVLLHKKEAGSGILRASSRQNPLVYGECWVTVGDSSGAAAAPSAIMISNDTLLLAPGAARKLSAAVVPQGAAGTVVWSSSDPSVAAVDSSGLVEARSDGEATVTASVLGKASLRDECQVTVQSSAARISDPGWISLSRSIVRISQEASAPVAVKATAVSTEGEQMLSQPVFWDLSGIEGIADAEAQGSSVSISPVNPGTGSLTAYALKHDGSRAEASLSVIVGTIASDELTAVGFSASQPVYLVLDEGTRRTVDVVYTPSIESLKGVAWSSSGTAAGYESSGSSATLFPVSAGSSTLMATTTANRNTPNITGSLAVTVVPTRASLPHVTSIELDRHSLVLDLADKSLPQITAAAFDFDGNPMKGEDMQFSCSSSLVAVTKTSASTAVVAKGTQTGSCVIEVTCASSPGVSAKCAVQVVDSTKGQAFAGLSLSNSRVTLLEGAGHQLTASAYPQSMATSCTWTVEGDQGAIAMVPSQDGMSAAVTALKQGTASAKASMTVAGVLYTASCAYTVVSTAVQIPVSISVAPQIIGLAAAGSSGAAHARILDAAGEECAGTVHWSVSGDAATLSPSGNSATVTAVKDGLSVLTASFSGISASAYVAVGGQGDGSLSGIIASPSALSMKTLQVRDISLTAFPEGAPLGTLQCSSSDENAASAAIVRTQEGHDILRITAEGQGSPRITVQSGTVTAYVDVSIAGDSAPSLVRISPSSLALSQAAGTSATAEASVMDADGIALDLDVGWSMSDDSVASAERAGKRLALVTPGTAGSARLTAACGLLSASIPVSVSERIAESAAAAPSSLVPSTWSVTLLSPDYASQDTTAEASVLFIPTNLASQYRNVMWSTSSSSVATVAAGADPWECTISAGKPGKAVITARSLADTSVSASIDVEVLTQDKAAAIIADGSEWSIAIDKTLVRLDAGGARATLAARIAKDGAQVMDAAAMDAVSWKASGDACIESSEGSVANVHGTATVRSTGTPGHAVLTASYDRPILRMDESGKPEVDAGGSAIIAGTRTISANSLIEVYDIEAEGQALSAVTLDSAAAAASPGEYVYFKAVPSPKLPDVEYSWESSDPGVLEMQGSSSSSAAFAKALAGGTSTVTVTASLGGVSVTDSCEVTVSRAIGVSGLYSSITLDKTSLTFAKGSSPELLTASLARLDGAPAPGNAIVEWTISGLSGKEMTGEAATDIVGPAVKVGTDPKVVMITPKSPGLAYITVTAWDSAERESGVSARCLVSVKGELTSAMLDTGSLRILMGESAKLSASYNAGASVSSEQALWEEVSLNASTGGYEAVPDGSGILVLSGQTASGVTVLGKSLGSTAVRLSVTRPATAAAPAGTLTAIAKVTVDDKAAMAGGIRKIEFPEAFIDASYPYAESSMAAKAVFMDGSESLDGRIVYALSDESKGLGTVRNAGGACLFAPSAPGTATVTATLDAGGGAVFTASCEIRIADGSEAIAVSSSSIALYTGGSTVLSVESSTENRTFGWMVINERTRAGRLIGDTEGAAVQSLGETQSPTETSSVFRAMRPVDPASSGDTWMKVIGTASVQTTSTQDGYSPELIDTFPRTATIVVIDDRGGRAEVGVTVNLLPEGNTYPAALSLSTSKETLTPPFTDEKTISASVTDADGKPAEATVDWYYYALGDSGWFKKADGESTDRPEERTAYLDPEAMIPSSNLLVSGYLSEDGKSLYYLPKQAGVYRVTAMVRENPQLRRTATLTVGGEVTGITASTGSSLTVAKGASAEIAAQLSPGNALARGVIWSVVTADGSRRMIGDGEVYGGSDYVRLTVNGSSMSVYGRKGTGDSAEDHSVAVRLEYYDSQAYAQIMSASDADRQEVYAGLASQLKYSYTVTIDVEAAKAVYSFELSGQEQVNPSSVLESALKYTASASVKGGDDAFTDWDWLDCQLVGNVSGMVYASSVPVLEDGTKVYGSDSGGWYTVRPDGTHAAASMPAGGWKYYNSSRDVAYVGDDGKPATARKPFSASAEAGGRLNREGSSCSFTLDQNGIPEEPVVLVTRLRDGIGKADGYDPDAMAVNEGRLLIYIGGAISELKAGTSILQNNGTQGITTTDLGTINLIEGASAILTLSYNPTYTHQKDVTWEVKGNTDGVLKVSDMNRRELSVIAEKLPDSKTRMEFSITATSTADRTKSFTFSVTVQSMIKSISFLTRSQQQSNKGASSTEPVYKDLDQPGLFPNVAGADEIYCYDIEDTSDGENAVDAYYIEASPTPDYGYDLSFRVVSGSDIGSIDTIGIDAEDNAFRFVPRGRVYDPEVEGRFSVTYGDVVVEAFNLDLNYSKRFTLHYRPSDFRVVRHLDDISGWKGIWDTASASGTTYLYGMECLVLREGEEFPLDLVMYDSNTSAVTELKASAPEDSRYAVEWSLFDDARMLPCPQDAGHGHCVVLRQEGNTCVASAAAGQQGTLYLAYTATYPSGTAITGGLPVYVIDPIDQELAMAVRIMSGKKGICQPISQKISRTQQDLWYGGAEGGTEEPLYDYSGAEITANRTLASRGKCLAAYSSDLRGISGLLLDLDSSSLTETAMSQSVWNTGSAPRLLQKIKVTGQDGIARVPGITSLKATREGTGQVPGFLADDPDLTAAGSLSSGEKSQLWLAENLSGGAFDLSGASGLRTLEISGLSACAGFGSLALPAGLESLVFTKNGYSGGLAFQAGSALRTADLSLNPFSSGLAIRDLADLESLSIDGFSTGNAPGTRALSISGCGSSGRPLAVRGLDTQFTSVSISSCPGLRTVAFGQDEYKKPAFTDESTALGHTEISGNSKSLLRAFSLSGFMTAGSAYQSMGTGSIVNLCSSPELVSASFSHVACEDIAANLCPKLANLDGSSQSACARLLCNGDSLLADFSRIPCIAPSSAGIGAKGILDASGCVSASLSSMARNTGLGTVLAAGVPEIGAEAFRGSGVSRLVIPDLVTIGDSAFRNCAQLTSVTFGSALSRIGAKAFSGCSGLTAVDFLAKGAGFKTMTIGNSDYDVWTGCPIRTARLARNAFGYNTADGLLSSFNSPRSETMIYARSPGYTVFSIEAKATGISINDSLLFEWGAADITGCFKQIGNEKIGISGNYDLKKASVTINTPAYPTGLSYSWIDRSSASVDIRKFIAKAYALSALSEADFASFVADDYHFTNNGRVGSDWLHSTSRFMRLLNQSFISDGQEKSWTSAVSGTIYVSYSAPQESYYDNDGNRHTDYATCYLRVNGNLVNQGWGPDCYRRSVQVSEGDSVTISASGLSSQDSYGSWTIETDSFNDPDFPFSNLDNSETCEMCIYPDRIDYMIPID